MTDRPLGPDLQFAIAWGGLRERRIGLVIATIIFIVSLFLSSNASLVVGTFVLFLAVWAIRRWPCPRCHAAFAGARPAVFAPRCAHCGLPEFTAPTEIASAPVVLGPADELPRGWRRTLAITQILSGAALSILIAWVSLGIYSIAFESLAVAAVAGGYWLWRNEARGYRFTRSLLTLQLVQFHSPLLSYGVAAGPQLWIMRVAGSTQFAANFSGGLTVTVRSSGPELIGVNLFAGFALLLMLSARSPDARVVAGSPVIAPTA